MAIIFAKYAVGFFFALKITQEGHKLNCSSHMELSRGRLVVRDSNEGLLQILMFYYINILSLLWVSSLAEKKSQTWWCFQICLCFLFHFFKERHNNPVYSKDTVLKAISADNKKYWRQSQRAEKYEFHNPSPLFLFGLSIGFTDENKGNSIVLSLPVQNKSNLILGSLPLSKEHSRVCSSKKAWVC